MCHVTHCNTLHAMCARPMNAHNLIGPMNAHNLIGPLNAHNRTYSHNLLSLPICFVHIATHCNTLQRTATHCNTLQHTATHCNTITIATQLQLQFAETCTNCFVHTATRCNKQQHTIINCNTLQHTATHCNTLQHTYSHNSLREPPRICVKT